MPTLRIRVPTDAVIFPHLRGRFWVEARHKQDAFKLLAVAFVVALALLALPLRQLGP